MDNRGLASCDLKPCFMRLNTLPDHWLVLSSLNVQAVIQKKGANNH